MKKLRWKKEPVQTGLARIGAGPRGSIYHDGLYMYATVYASGGSWNQPFNGWYWVAGWGTGIPHKNTCNTPCATEAEAKEEAEAYVKQHIQK